MNTIQLIDRKGKVRKGKKVVITTTFDCNINEVWQRIQNGLYFGGNMQANGTIYTAQRRNAYKLDYRQKL